MVDYNRLKLEKWLQASQMPVNFVFVKTSNLLKETKMTESANHEHDRRQSFRIDMEKELIDLMWCNDQGQQQQLQLTCLDFSRGGVRVECEQMIALDTEVTVIFNATHPNARKLVASVLRCQPTTTGTFEIALRMADK
jgi:hypothetical protein